jgi:hypothetical protein
MVGVYKNCVTFVTMCKVVAGRFSCQPKISAANFCQNIKTSKHQNIKTSKHQNIKTMLPPPTKKIGLN